MARVHLEAAPGAQSVSELRMRVFAERHDEFGSHLRINLAGYVDGLVADRAGADLEVVGADLKVGPYSPYSVFPSLA